MPIICPTITGTRTEEEYRQQMERVAPFAHRLQIDLTDGDFASPKTINPGAAWWPAGVMADFHIMYNEPLLAVKTVLAHKPHLIIVHAEADGSFDAVAKECRRHKTKIGVALLPQTSPRLILPALDFINHVLIFSGHLGHFGGQVDLSLLDKVKYLKQHKSSLEVGWDGGIDSQNVAQLVFGGVDVLNVGGAISQAQDPQAAFTSLQRIADETGTT